MVVMIVIMYHSIVIHVVVLQLLNGHLIGAHQLLHLKNIPLLPLHLQLILPHQVRQFIYHLLILELLPIYILYFLYSYFRGLLLWLLIAYGLLLWLREAKRFHVRLVVLLRCYLLLL